MLLPLHNPAIDENLRMKKDGTYFRAETAAELYITKYHPLTHVPEHKCSSYVRECKFNNIKLNNVGKKSRNLAGQRVLLPESTDEKWMSNINARA